MQRLGSVGGDAGLADSFTFNFEKMKLKLKPVPEHYIFVADYEWPFKNEAKIHANRFEDGIFRWNPIVNKYEVFRPEYSK